SLADQSNPINTSIEGVPYSIYYETVYIDDAADGTILAGTDTAPNDYKQVKLTVHNNTTGLSNSFLTNVSPSGLEGLTNAGALYIRVFNANGQPVSGASVQIQNSSLNPALNVTRTSDSSGYVLEVGLPASVNGYNITVTKSGYSSDQTYAISAQN